MAVGYHKWYIGRHYRTKKSRNAQCHIIKMSINGASTIIGLASSVLYMALDP